MVTGSFFYSQFTIYDLRLSLPKRHSQSLQKCARLIVVVRRGHNRDIHSAQFVDLIKINLRKDQLLADANRIVSTAVEGFRRDSTKISYAWQGNRNQAIKKLVHAFAAQRHHNADGHPLPQLETGDR